MAGISKVARDQRNISRTSTELSCHFTYDGVSREALVVDLSLTGALLESPFMPPIGSDLTVSLRAAGLKGTLKLEAKVIRGGWGISNHGAIGKFGIRFVHNYNTQLASLITKH